jgi:hypothetical protein
MYARKKPLPLSVLCVVNSLLGCIAHWETIYLLLHILNYTWYTPIPTADTLTAPYTRGLSRRISLCLGLYLSILFSKPKKTEKVHIFILLISLLLAKKNEINWRDYFLANSQLFSRNLLKHEFLLISYVIHQPKVGHLLVKNISDSKENSSIRVLQESFAKN